MLAFFPPNAPRRIEGGSAVGNLRAYVERLEREARVVSRLRHRNIIDVYGSFTFEKVQTPSGEEFFGDQLPCISMEYVEDGDTLAHFEGLLGVPPEYGRNRPRVEVTAGQ